MSILRHASNSGSSGMPAIDDFMILRLYPLDKSALIITGIIKTIIKTINIVRFVSDNDVVSTELIILDILAIKNKIPSNIGNIT